MLKKEILHIKYNYYLILFKYLCFQNVFKIFIENVIQFYIQ